MDTQRTQSSDVVESTEELTSINAETNESENESATVTGAKGQIRDNDALSTESSSDSEDEIGGPSWRLRQSPSWKNATDAHGVPFLTILPRDERRRIQLEARKNKRPAFTVSKVSKVLEVVAWGTLCNILCVPGSKRQELEALFASDECRREEAIKWWIMTDPLAGWRRLVHELYRWSANECAIGDKIRHYCEELNDPSLTHSNVTCALTSVSTERLTVCLMIPYSVEVKITDVYKDVRRQRQQFIHYYVNYSPYSTTWIFLSGRLHRWEETTAETYVKKFVRGTPGPTFNINNLSHVLEGVQNMESVALQLNIPLSKWIEMEQRNPNKRDHRRVVVTYYIERVPGATWLGVADALWWRDEYTQLEVVNKLYLRGTTESRRILEKSLKCGFIDAFIDKILFNGSAGVGKTSMQKIVAGEDPPKVRTSTPLATRPITIYQILASKGVWRRYDSDDRMKLCARISKTVIGNEIIETIKSKKPQKEPKPPPIKRDKAEHKAGAVQVEDVNEKGLASSERAEVCPNVIKVIHDVIDKMYQLIDEVPDGVDPITYLHKVRIVDCGGQPQFREILPIFLRKLSMIVFVINLSEQLSTRPTIEYYENGKALGVPYKSDCTTEQLLKQGLQSIHSHRSNKDSKGESPRIVVVGTHKDLEKNCEETREMKNQKLREMLLPAFSKDVVYSQPATNDVIFAMNAKEPGEEEEAVASAIRSMIARKQEACPRKLPLMWLTLEIILEEITKKLDRGVLTMRECQEIARRLRFDLSTLDAALIYFDEMSLIFYYRDILPGLVFTNPQVVHSKISELVKIHHDKMKSLLSMSEAWQEFYHHALITLEFLSQEMFNEHYVPGIFEPKHVVLLYRKLLIFADYSERQIFVPCLLRMLGDEEVSKKRVALDSPVAPLVLRFPDGPPRHGIFCALVSFLTSPDNHFLNPWKIKMPPLSVTPMCLYRNCIQFTIPAAKCPCSVTLIDTQLQFEVHLKVPPKKSASVVCSSIKQAISTGLQKANLALGYLNSTPTFALICPCGVGHNHHATIGDGYWICSLDEDNGNELNPNQCVWMEDKSAINITSSLGSEKHSCGLTSKPRLYELDRIKGNGKAVKVIDRTAAHWERVATTLHFEGHEIKTIRADYHQCEDACRNLFIEWIDGKGRQPKTWETVISALNEADFGDVSSDLSDVLTDY